MTWLRAPEIKVLTKSGTIVTNPSFAYIVSYPGFLKSAVILDGDPKVVPLPSKLGPGVIPVFLD